MVPVFGEEKEGRVQQASFGRSLRMTILAGQSGAEQEGRIGVRSKVRSKEKAPPFPELRERWGTRPSALNFMALSNRFQSTLPMAGR